MPVTHGDDTESVESLDVSSMLTNGAFANATSELTSALRLLQDHVQRSDADDVPARVDTLHVPGSPSVRTPRSMNGRGSGGPRTPKQQRSNARASRVASHALPAIVEDTDDMDLVAVPQDVVFSVPSTLAPIVAWDTETAEFLRTHTAPARYASAGTLPNMDSNAHSALRKLATLDSRASAGRSVRASLSSAFQPVFSDGDESEATADDTLASLSASFLSTDNDRYWIPKVPR